MDFRDAIKSFRTEMGITQIELATVLHINSATIRRWELGQNLPNRSAVAMLLNYAKKSGASPECVERLRQSSAGAAKSRLVKKNGSLFSIEHSSFEELIEAVNFPIYVCDIQTDELLYLNRWAMEMAGDPEKNVLGAKCYECLMHRDSPCEFCHKSQLKSKEFTAYNAYRSLDGTSYRIQGKKIRWNGHDAQIRCVSNVGQTVSTSVLREQERNYAGILRSRKEATLDRVAMAHFNLSKNTVSDIQSESESVMKLMTSGSANEVLKALAKNTYDKDEQRQFSALCTRSIMINYFYNGKTHISIKHHLKGDKRLYESTFDLMQNPTTFDIEAVAVLRNITDGALVEDVASALFGLDYETILLIDAETGEAHPLFSGNIEGVLDEQKKQGDYVAGVTEYLKKHCVDADVDRIIRETSLTTVNAQLKTKRRYTVAYALNLNSRIIHKRTFFSYLDSTHTTILCAMQDISETVRNEDVNRDRLSTTLKAVHEIGGIDIGLYDLSTRALCSNSSKILTELGFSDVIEDVPETFIRGGYVSASSVDEFRRFFASLGDSPSSAANLALKSTDGSFHWFYVNARILYGENNEPEHAIIIYQDVEEKREHAAIYRKWKQSISCRAAESFTLFCCNLSRGASFDMVEGALLPQNYLTDSDSFNDRVYEYANRYICPDDRKFYIELLNSETLMRAYRSGISTASINYRELSADSEYRWIHLSVEMVQYPDSEDVEVFLLFEKL